LDPAKTTAEVAVSVRLATRADIERLVDLNNEVQELHLAQLPHVFKPARREDLRAYFEQTLASPEARVLVACDGAHVVGYTLLVVRERPENPVAHALRSLYIEQIGVTETHQRHGHATALIEAARALARKEDLPRIELDTWGFNERAQAFFRSQGFRIRTIKMELDV
jgi:ribosomal protein S18 acetylase RimI-like enzyme